MNIVHIILVLLVSILIGYALGIMVEGKRIKKVNETFKTKTDLPSSYEEFKELITTKYLNIGNILDICSNYCKKESNEK